MCSVRITQCYVRAISVTLVSGRGKGGGAAGTHLRGRRRLRAAGGASPAGEVRRSADANIQYTLDTMRTKPSSSDFCDSDDESTTI